MDTVILDKNSEQALLDTIEQLQKKGAILGYYQLRGLLFAIACSPEKIQPCEWFDLIWLNDTPQFDSEEEARAFYNAIVSLSEQVTQMIHQRCYIPFGPRYSDHWQREMADWCDGMLMGHQYLEDLWQCALDDLHDPDLTEDIDTSLCLACTFADLANARHLSSEHGIALTDEHLPEVYALFCKVLGAYACVRRMWLQLSSDQDWQSVFDSMEPTARDASCPCGSGVAFAKCCLH